jgi:hypothetical protein
VWERAIEEVERPGASRNCRVHIDAQRCDIGTVIPQESRRGREDADLGAGPAVGKSLDRHVEHGEIAEIRHRVLAVVDHDAHGRSIGTACVPA